MPENLPLRAIAEDIYRLVLPLPFALNSVNIYLLRGDDGWTVLDCGLHTPEAAALWARACAELGIQPADIARIVLTHAHPDHYGMAGKIQAEAAAAGRHLPVHLTATESRFAEQMWKSAPSREIMRAHLRLGGMPGAEIAIVADAEDFTRKRTNPQADFVAALQPGRVFRLGNRSCLVIHAPGHCDGQAIFYDEADRLLFCGDHVLIKITPNIGLWPGTLADPLGRYLASLEELSALEVRLALPGHRDLITDWRGRLVELRAHHEARLAHTLLACERPATAYEVSDRLFDTGRFSAHEWRFAMVEALAHLEYLEIRGRLRRSGERVWRYERID